MNDLAVALQRTSWRAEIVVVDDGSTDDTAETLTTLVGTYPYPIRVVHQDNAGVFLAVWEGLQASGSDLVLVLNSRLLVHSGALEYLEQAMVDSPDVRVWNGHVVTDSSAPLVGQFWDVPLRLFWGDYLSNPTATMITPENFDRVPKGTGLLVVPRELLKTAYIASWPQENARLTSDDTKLLRFISQETPIRLDPQFSATYRPRLTFRKFLIHSRGRGPLFVDSYAGTSTLRNTILILLVAAPPLALVAIIALAARGKWMAVKALLGIALTLLAAPVPIAAVRGASRRAMKSYLVFIVPFGVVFWSGLARGLIAHRKAFYRAQNFDGDSRTS